MSGHVHWGDPEPVFRDVPKPVLVRRASTLAVLPTLGGLLLFLVLFFGLPIFGAYDQGWVWWYLAIWLSVVGVCFLVRRSAVNGYKGRVVKQARRARLVENARRPRPLTTEYAVGIADAADDALTRRNELAPAAARLQATVEDMEAKEQAHVPREQHLQEAVASKRAALAAQNDADAAQFWLDAANSYRLAGDTKEALEASAKGYELNPFKPPLESQ